MTKKQKEAYEQSLRQLSDTYATHEFSREEGFEDGRIEGRAEEKTQIIKNLLSTGEVSISFIAKAASVDEAFVLAIKNNLDKEDK